MIGDFTFVAGGRTYTCTVEKRHAPPAGTWRWFAVTNDQQRYAPFEVASNDTEKSTRERIVAYYENVLAIRARPVVPRQGWGQRGRPPANKPVVAPVNDED